MLHVLLPGLREYTMCLLYSHKLASLEDSPLNIADSTARIVLSSLWSLRLPSTGCSAQTTNRSCMMLLLGRVKWCFESARYAQKLAYPLSTCNIANSNKRNQLRSIIKCYNTCALQPWPNSHLNRGWGRTLKIALLLCRSVHLYKAEVDW